MLSFLLFLLFCFLSLYYYLTRRYTYWLRKNVPCPGSSLFFGNKQDVATFRTIVIQNVQKIYEQYEGHPFVGIYTFTKPVLLLRDPKLIKQFFVKDFDYFQNRGIAMNECADPLTANLINLNGRRWRNLRTRLTPAFASNKIRHVFGLIKIVSEKLQQLAGEYADNKEPVEFRNVAAKFTSDVVASCFFGVETNTLQSDDNEFRRMFQKLMDPSLTMGIKIYMRDYMPGVLRWLSVTLIPSDVSAYFTRIVNEVITHRETNNVTRDDIMQTLIDLKSKRAQEVTSTQSQDTLSEVDDAVFDDKVIAAQAYIFFVAGFDASSTMMSFAMCELAANPKIQEKLYDEMRIIYKKHGCFSYDAISEMKYLDCVVRETFRRYPSSGIIQRICEESYKIPNSDVVVEKGTKIFVPVYAIHHDPLYYKDPNTFDPSRFLDENKTQRDNYTFIPFGGGPRICIGMRFAYVQIKAGLVALIANYKVELNEKTSMPLQFEPTGISLTSKSGIWLNFHRRTQDLTGG